MPMARFYRHHSVDPYRNMAFDEWLLSIARENPGAVLVRVYTWAVGSITIGVNQTLERAIRSVDRGDTPIIRRITGGRALYHDCSELTYAIAAHPHKGQPAGWEGPRSTVYALLARTIEDFLGRVGIESRLVRPDRPEVRPDARDSVPPCFSSSARHELVSNGTKIVASAQRQIGSAFLQHGSIKLTGIASHPALPGVPDAVSDLQPIPVEQFHVLARQFKMAFEAAIGGALDESETSWSDRESLRQRVREVHRDPLGRRDNFEQ
jgi:lipoate-protein ligase A